MKKISIVLTLFVCTVALSACSLKEQRVKQTLTDPKFDEVTVHDPAIIQANDSFYVFGSHMASANSKDLIHWNQLSTSVASSTLFEDIRKELEPEFSYAKTNTTWAPDIIQLEDGKYYLYYCLCQGTSPLSVLGVAVADKIEGPYKKVESFIYSGTSPQFGETYDATIMPNAVDPNVFFDEKGKLWMVYGSYSGGIFILELNPKTGLPLDRNSYGKHLMGGNHARIEAPYISYNKETGYYYLFTSYGGLDADGGYNIRVARSKNPDGPYEDSQGTQMTEVKGKSGTVFDDVSIQNSGNKLLGNFLLTKNDEMTNDGYVSPGHNSVYRDKKTNEYFLVFHTRFPNSGENHEVRVHKMYFNKDGWPVVSPLRYAKEDLADYTKKMVAGDYQLIQFTKEISEEIAEPKEVQLKSANKISGEVQGNWTLAEKNTVGDSQVTIDGEEYTGKFISGWNQYTKKQTMTFTGTSKKGVPLFLIKK